MRKVEQIINAMNLLGGHCSYEDLYNKLQEIYQNCAVGCKNIKVWKSTIRETIERYSSDSKVYKGREDIFYSVDGVGKGHWGLRTPHIDENTMDVTADDEGFAEGKEILRKHILRERNHSLKIEAMKRFKNKHNNQIFCEACGFNFEEQYGEVGKDFIEAHHTKPVSEMEENEQTKIEDIALLCSNCHSMIHRKRPWLKKEDIKKLIDNKF